MTGSLKSEEEFESESSEMKDTKSPIVIPVELVDDFDFKQLLEFFQNGEFSKCREKLIELEKRYPNNPELLKI